MAIRWIDVSVPLRPETTVWPGDPPFQLTPASRIAKGDSCNTSRVRMGTHTGTHIDAPWHFDDNNPQLDHIDTDLFFGGARLYDMAGASVVTPADFGADPLPPRILIKTRSSEAPSDGPFSEGFVAVGADAARRLVAEHVRMVGIDSMSIAPYRQQGHDTHRILLGNNIPCVEGLRLSGLLPGWYQFVVLPLPIAGSDGAPCRAFVGLEGS